MNPLTRDFERFQGGPMLPSNTRLHVTINHKYTLYLNTSTHRLLGKPEAVYLYFSREKDMIVLEPTSPRMPQAFPVRQRQSSFLIHATPFCRHFGIRLDTTLRFIMPDIQSGRLMLRLSDTVVVTKRPRRKKIDG